MYLSGCIHSSRPNWFIIHMKRSDTCSRFSEIMYQLCSYQRSERKAESSHILQAGLNSQSDYFVYFCADDDNSMVTVMLYRRPYNNCTLVLATVSEYTQVSTRVEFQFKVLFKIVSSCIPTKLLTTLINGLLFICIIAALIIGVLPVS